MNYQQPLYRPPSEANSLILQATIGCSHNRCRFCYMYRGNSFRVKRWEHLKAEIDECSRVMPRTRRIFLADGDALVLSTGKLARILDYLNRSFPGLERVTAYASPGNLLDKSVENFKLLREKGLEIVYYGVESGDPELLRSIDKGATPDQMAEGCAKVREGGVKLSVTVILGLAGKAGSEVHAGKTAALLNRIQPRYLSALTLMLGPYQDEYRDGMGNDFEFNTPLDNVRELKVMLENLRTDRCIFRSNHASNYLSLKGTLLKSKPRLLDEIDRALDHPGEMLREDWMRGL